MAPAQGFAPGPREQACGSSASPALLASCALGCSCHCGRHSPDRPAGQRAGRSGSLSGRPVGEDMASHPGESLAVSSPHSCSLPPSRTERRGRSRELPGPPLHGGQLGAVLRGGLCDAVSGGEGRPTRLHPGTEGTGAIELPVTLQTSSVSKWAAWPPRFCPVKQDHLV